MFLYSGVAIYPSIDDSSIESVNFSYERGFAFGYEFRKVTPNSWGGAAGFEWHLARELDSVVVERKDSADDSFSLGSSPAEVSAKYLYYSWIYMWNEFYIPFGINYLMIDISRGDSFLETPKTSNGVGFQFGLGWQFNSNISGEWMVRSSAHSLEVGSSDYRMGAYASGSFGIRYSF